VSNEKRPRVVIVGAGFGGLSALKALANKDANVLLVDRNNYHTFLALLYQVAAAELEPAQIAHPVRTILRKMRNVRFGMTEVQRVDLARKVIETDIRDIPYDYLILSPGSVTNYYGVAGAAENTFPLKSMDNAIRLRNHILECLELAVRDPDPDRKQRLMNLVIVGGGATGVEMAGALAELLRGPLSRDYPNLDFGKAQVVILEATDKLLPGFPDPLQEYAADRLRRMGVDVRFNAAVARVTKEDVTLADGAKILTETVCWTAGARGSDLPASSQIPTVRSGRVKVLPTLQMADHPDVYVIGDLAHFEQDGRPLAMVAAPAIQEGTLAAQNILRQIAGQPLLEFRYKNPGIMATIGRNIGVANLWGRWQFKGFSAWVLWLFVHLARMISHRNRLFVLLDWAWDYLLHERSIRMIIRGG